MDTLINEILNYLLTSPYASYATLAIAIFYIIAHIIAILPEKFASKIPAWLMAVINAIAANYKNAKNAKK
jgi:hypothetical protein